MIWGLLLVIVLSGIIIVLFRCMDFPQDDYEEIEEDTEKEIRREKFDRILKVFKLNRDLEEEDNNFEKFEEEESNHEMPPQLETDLLQVVGYEDEDEGATYMRSGLEIRIYSADGTYPIAVEEIPGGKSVIRIGRSIYEDNDILIKNRMVSKSQYELCFNVDQFGKEEVFLKAVKEQNPIRIANSNWQEIRTLHIDDKYCLSNEKYNRFLINRMGVKMEIVNFFVMNEEYNRPPFEESIFSM